VPTSSELHKTPAGIFFRQGLVCRHLFPKFQEHDREVIIKGVLAVEGTHILFNYVNDLIASQGLYGIIEALNETLLAVLLTAGVLGLQYAIGVHEKGITYFNVAFTPLFISAIFKRAKKETVGVEF